jgi:hypothetical protein
VVRAGLIFVVALALLAPAAAGLARRGSAARPQAIAGATWHAVGLKVAGAPPLMTTSFSPNRSDPATVAYLVWIDHTRAAIGLYPGLREPPTASPRGPAEIPWSQRWRALAAFNGGFKYAFSYAENGFSVNGHTYVWLKPGLGTLVGYRDGRVDIVRWHGPPNPPPNVAFARQNLPLLVNRGRPAPGIDNGPAWGATLGHVANVWRTGVGVDGNGNLLYAAAGNQTARSFAAILIRAGAVRAIELDINPEWPTFNLYAHRGGIQPTMFVPNVQQNAWRYLRPEERDFFAVYRRTTGSAVRVPFR